MYYTSWCELILNNLLFFIIVCKCKEINYHLIDFHAKYIKTLRFEHYTNKYTQKKKINSNNDYKKSYTVIEQMIIFFKLFFPYL